ncbi:MAG: GFA family protein [Marinosulfonomonas sp.]|nr:GFA family protein [Marinosulfonomonas sp.]
MHKGSCLCGAVQFEVSGGVAGVSVCHCSQCCKQSGHLWASGFVPDAALTITREGGVCGVFGAFLFWRKPGQGTTSFSLGSLDGPTGLKLQKHIFVADQGDYYDISDGLVQEQ